MLNTLGQIGQAIKSGAVGAVQGAYYGIKSTFTLASDKATRIFGSFAATWAEWHYRKLVQAVCRNPIASRAVRYIGSNMAKIPLKVVRDADGTVEEVPDHPFNALRKRPHPRHTWSWFMDGFVWQLLTQGEFFLYAFTPETRSRTDERYPRRLMLYQGEQFQRFIRDDAGEIIGYRFTTAPRRDRMAGGRWFKRTVEECMHAYTYNPLNPEMGLSVIGSIYKQIQLQEEGDEWNKGLAERGGQIPVFFSPTSADGRTPQTSPEQQQQAQEAVNRKWRSLEKRNLPWVLSGAYEIIKNALSPQEADWLEMSKDAGRKIAGGLGIDPALLGMEEAQTYDNFQTARKQAYQETIVPILSMILNEMNHWLMPKYAAADSRWDGCRIEMDLSEVEALQEDRNKRAERVAMLFEKGTFSLNMALQALGEDEMSFPEADMHFIAINRVPMSGSMLSDAMPQGAAKAITHRPADKAAMRHLRERLKDVQHMDDEAFEQAIHELTANVPDGGITTGDGQ